MIILAVKAVLILIVITASILVLTDHTKEMNENLKLDKEIKELEIIRLQLELELLVLKK